MTEQFWQDQFNLEAVQVMERLAVVESEIARIKALVTEAKKTQEFTWKLPVDSLTGSMGYLVDRLNEYNTLIRIQGALSLQRSFDTCK